MDKELLEKTVTRLVAKPKGILAIDESLPTCKSRFEKLGIPFTEEKRREYREVLVTAPGLEQYINALILVDETFYHKTKDGLRFTEVLKNRGIDFGITAYTNSSVDSLLYPGEKITEGLDGLSERLKKYKEAGATFSKWRAVYIISSKTPSAEIMKAHAKLFAEYAKLCQKESLVPIVEPEILMDGNHTLEECYKATAANLKVVFGELKAADVYLPGIILKTSMVLPGNNLELIVDDSEIAKMTIKCLKENVPEEVGGVVFLSGGQPDQKATIRLNEIAKLGPKPWPLTFSYGRAIQNPALKYWAQNPSDVATAQALLVAAARNNSLASIGEYKNEIPPPRREQGGE